MFLRVSSAINMPQTTLSCCPQHAAWRHVDDVASLCMASAKEMAIKIVVLLGRNVYLNLKTVLLILRHHQMSVRPFCCSPQHAARVHAENPAILRIATEFTPLWSQ